MAPLYKEPPLAHQLRAIAKAKGKKGFMFSCEQGTGKTFIEINEIAQLWGEGKINGVIVFAPNGVHSNWVEIELPKFMPDWVRWRSRAWNSAALADEARDFETILSATENDSSELRIMTMNWEALTAERSLGVIKQFIRGATKLMLVGDESQAIANPTIKRCKELAKIRMQAVVRRTMTGTPVLNAPFDLFGQYDFLDPGTILGTTSFVAFKAEYADMIPAHHPMMKHIMEKRPTANGRVPQIVMEDPITGLPSYKNLDKLARLVEPYTFRVLKAECLDLPEKVYTQSFFELEPGQRKAYRLMEKEFRFLVGQGPDQTAVSKLTSLGKLTQISSGFLIDTAEQRTQLVVDQDDNPKLKLLRDRLRESVNELKNKVIVFAHYIHEIEDIETLCWAEGWKPVVYRGSTTKAERTQAIADFEAGKIDVFIGQIDTASTGITLVAASHVIYYSNTFSWGDRSQSEDRAHRIGQTKTVLYEDLVGKGTRDLRIIEALRAKKNLAEIVNGDARELLKD